MSSMTRRMVVGNAKKKKGHFSARLEEGVDNERMQNGGWIKRPTTETQRKPNPRFGFLCVSVPLWLVFFFSTGSTWKDAGLTRFGRSAIRRLACATLRSREF